MAATKRVIVAIQGKDEFSGTVTKAGRKTSSALRQVEKAQDKTKRSSKELTAQQRAMASTMGNAKKAMLGFAAGAVSIGGVVILFKKLAGAMGDAVAASAAQEIQFLKLDNTLRNLNINTEENRIHFRALAGEMQNVRGIADDVAAGLFAQLLAFGATKENVEEVTAAVQDLSIGMGSDLKSSALLMGKALAGEFGTLSRYGIIIDQNLTDTEKMDEALRQISMRFGGLGAAMTFTSQGAANQLLMKLGDIEERFGDVITKQKEWIVLLKGSTLTLTLFEEELNGIFTAMGSASDASDILAEAMVLVGLTIDRKVFAPLRGAIFALRLIGDAALSVGASVPFLDELAGSVRDMTGDVFDSGKAWEDSQDAAHDATQNLSRFAREARGVPTAIAEAEAALESNASGLADVKTEAELAALAMGGFIGQLDELIKKRDEASTPSLSDIFPKPGDLPTAQTELPFFTDTFDDSGAKGASQDADVDRVARDPGRITVTGPSSVDMASILEQFAQLDAEIAAQTLEARTNLAIEELEQKELLLQEMFEAGVLNEEAIAELMLEMKDDRVVLLESEWDERLALVEGNTDAEFALLQQLDLKKKALAKGTEKEIANIKKISAKEQMQTAFMVAEASLDALQTIFGDNKAFAIAGAIISTARGVAGALEIQPPPLGIALGILIAAAGAVQIARIRSSEPQGAAHGALVTGNTLLEAGEGNRPELVIPLEDARGQRAITQALGGGGGINLTVVNNGPTFADEEDFGDFIVERLEDAVDRGVVNRQTERRV